MNNKILKSILISIMTVCLFTACGNSDSAEESTTTESSMVSTQNETDVTVEAETTEPVEETEAAGLEKVEAVDYITTTAGDYLMEPVEVGTTFTAYPIDEIVAFMEAGDVTSANAYEDVYEGEDICITGYVHLYKEGFFVLTASEADAMGMFQNVVVIEDRNVRADNGWNIQDGDMITMVGRMDRVFSPGKDFYLVVNNPFLVESK